MFWRVIDVKTSFTQTLVIESWQNHEWALRFFKRKCKLFLSKYKLCATQRFRRWKKPNFSWTWPNKLMQRGKWLQIIIVYKFSISVTEYHQLLWSENNHNCVMTNPYKKHNNNFAPYNVLDTNGRRRRDAFDQGMPSGLSWSTSLCIQFQLIIL